MYNFTKAHGLKNDFVIFENVSFDEISQRVTFISDRHAGIGCDTVICLNAGFVKFWNKDGSVAAFCGNGARCVARYMTENGEVSFLTDSGEVSAWVNKNSVKMLYPITPKMLEENNSFFKVNTGNKHIVIQRNAKVIDWSEILAEYGKELEKGYNLISLCGNWMDVYEFGVGPTESCGSGAVACAFVLAKKARSSRQIVINSRGGPLTMEFENGSIYQTGSAQLVFTGEINL